ncbi:MAG: phosphogluconate dehydratase [Burkholderiaceae bacterium]
MNATLTRVTQRIIDRSKDSRGKYLATVAQAIDQPPARDRFGCANLAHAWAAMPGSEKIMVRQERATNLAIVTAYNDILSAHQPYQDYPALIRDEALKHRATVQVAGGVPAMCDGVTQGTDGMELSLFSRDVIAMGTAVALSHQMFDAALLLGICDKIVPGLLIGALHFGHLPCVFVPAGPMPTGLSNTEKSATRKKFARGEASRDELLDAELGAYHSPGTCTFYGTANSNQMLLEAMGLQLPGASFVQPGTRARDDFTREAVRRALSLANPKEQMPIGHIVDERCIVNAMVALLATGGSTNHLIHWVAVAQAAGIQINWQDFDELSSVIPLLARVYPNGEADVNAFEAAGGTRLVLRELMTAGLMHADVNSIHAQGIPEAMQSGQTSSADLSVVRPVSKPFAKSGGLRLLTGKLGRAVIKTSSIPKDRHRIQAPARVFDSQQAMLDAFNAGDMNQDAVVIIRFQGPRANGMPELHKLTPPLAVLQDKGFRVALVTDGRMSGASGVVPAAIHVTPECLNDGPLGKVRDGDIMLLDANEGILDIEIDATDFEQREHAMFPQTASSQRGVGRELFSGFRDRASGAEQGACTW